MFLSRCEMDRSFQRPLSVPVNPFALFDKICRLDVNQELSVLALIKGTERYYYVYDDDSRSELLSALRDQAANPRLSLSWLDAGVLIERARQQGLAGAETTHTTG